MTLQARHVLNVTLAARLRVVRDIFSTRSTQFHGRFFSCELRFQILRISDFWLVWWDAVKTIKMFPSARRMACRVILGRSESNNMWNVVSGGCG